MAMHTHGGMAPVDMRPEAARPNCHETPCSTAPAAVATGRLQHGKRHTNTLTVQLHDANWPEPMLRDG
jgi:hypothetical protein